MILKELSFFTWRMRSRWKSLAVSLALITLALTLFTGSIYYTESSRNDLYLDLLNESASKVSHPRYSFDYGLQPVMDTINSIETGMINNSIDHLFTAERFYPVVDVHSFVFTSGNINEQTVISAFQGLNSSIIEECVEGSHFPVNHSDIIIYASEESSVSLGDEITVNIIYTASLEGSFGSRGFTFNVSAIITDTSMNNDSKYRDILQADGYRFFTSLNMMDSLIEDNPTPINVRIAGGEILGMRIYVDMKYRYNTSTVGSPSAINTVESILTWERHVAQNNPVSLQKGITATLGAARDSADLFLSIFILFSLPVLFLIAILSIFSLDIVIGGKEKSVVLDKTRGRSSKSVVLSFIAELVVIATVTTIISTIAGIPLAMFIGSTSGFLSFTGTITISNYLKLITPSTLSILLVSGVIFTFITHLPAIFRISAEKTSSTAILDRNNHRKKGLISSLTVEFVLLLAGFSGYFILSMLNNTVKTLAEEMNVLSMFEIFTPVILLLSFLSPLMVLLGTVMILNKFVMMVIPLLGKLFRRFDWKILTSSTKQLIINTRFTSRTMLMLAVALCFLFLIAVLPLTVQRYSEDIVHYTQGADMVINLGSCSEQTLDNITFYLGELPDLATTRVFQAELNYEYYLGDIEYYFTGVEENFHTVAHWKSHYSEKSLEETVGILYDSPELFPVLQDHSAAVAGITSIFAGGYGSTGTDYHSIRFNVDPIQEIELFPGIYRDNHSINTGHFICRYSDLVGRNATDFMNFDVDLEVWCKIQPGYGGPVTIDLVEEILEQNGFDISVLSTASRTIDENSSSLVTKLQWIIVNYNILCTVIIVIIILLLFFGVKLLRDSGDIAISRILGMKLPQIMRLYCFEILLLLFFSCFQGMILCFTLLYLLVVPTTSSILGGPPVAIHFDLSIFFPVFIVFIIISIVTGMTAATISSSSIFTNKGYARRIQEVPISPFITESFRNLWTKMKQSIRMNPVVFIRRNSKLLFVLSRVNLRLFMGSLLGLIIALSMLSGCLFFIEFSRPEIYLDYFEEENYNQLMFYSWSRAGGGKSASEITALKNQLDTQVEQRELGQLLQNSPIPVTSSLLHRTYYQGTGREQMIIGYDECDDVITEESIAGSSLPLNPNEVMAIAPVNSGLKLSENVTITLAFLTGLTERTYRFNFTVTGIMNGQSIGKESILRENYQVNEYYFFMPLDHFISLITSIETGLADLGFPRELDLINRFAFAINHRDINRAVAIESVEGTLALLKEIEISGPLYNDREFKGEFEIYVANSLTFSQQFLIISIPILILIAGLVFFSLGLINEKRLKSIALVKNKGLSGRFIFCAMIMETLILALIATTASIVIGIPVTLFIGKTVNFMDFSGQADYVFIFSPSTIIMIFILGVLFTFLTHLPSMFKLSRSSVISLQEESSKKKRRKINMITGQIDLMLLLLGTIGILFFSYLTEYLNVAISQDPELVASFSLIYITLAVISPLLFLTGCIMSYNRIIPPALHLISNFFWKRDWRLLAVVTRNLGVNTKLTSRITILMAITMSLLVSLIILPLSVQPYQEEVIYYDLGSDITMQLPFGLAEHQIETLLQAVGDIEGLLVTRVNHAESAVSEDITGKYIVKFLGVEEGISNIIYWQDHYDDENINSLVSTLLNSPLSSAVIIDAKSSELTSLNQSISLPRSFYEPINVTPVAVTSNFPGVAPYWTEENIHVICKYSSLSSIVGISSLQLEKEIWGAVQPGYDSEIVLDQFRDAVEILGYNSNDVNSVPEDIDEARSTRMARSLWQIINWNFMGGMAIIMSTIILYSFASLSRSIREVGLSRALGIKKHQLYLMMLMEPIALFFLAGIPGGIIGGTLMTVLISASGPSLFLGPPFILNLNLPLLTAIFAFILVSMIIIGVFTSIIATRANISKILKSA